MKYEVYKLIHISGAFLVLMSFAAASFWFLAGANAEAFKKKFVSINHGIGMFLLLLGGFGMLARLKMGLDVWVYIKLTIWLIFGFYILIIRKKPALSMHAWYLGLILALVAASMAIYKPFLSS